MRLNILVPIGGGSNFFDAPEYKFPKPLVEICGRPMIQLVIENIAQIERDKQMLFVVREKDTVEHHLDRIIKLLAPPPVHVFRQPVPSAGAAGSCLLAVDEINNDHPLLIVNSDQIIRADLDGILSRFEERGAAAGVICHDSIHPKWSYAKTDARQWVVETAEKKPISRNAIAGAYYFRQGRFFVEAAKTSILKNAQVNGAFYIAPVLNELILRNLRVAMETIPESQYFSFYSPGRIKEYEERVHAEAHKPRDASPPTQELDRVQPPSGESVVRGSTKACLTS